MLINRPLTMLLLCLLCFSENSNSQEFKKNGDFVTYRGNRFEYSKAGKTDTQVLVDPVDGHEIWKIIQRDPTPIRMNKMRIYNMDEVTLRPAPKKEPLQTFVIRSVTRDLNKLPDGVYFIDLFNVIIDDKGKIVYYEYGSILPQNNKIKVPADIKTVVDKKIDSVINKAPGYTPGAINGSSVVVRTDIFYDTYKIKVKNHKTSIGR